MFSYCASSAVELNAKADVCSVYRSARTRQEPANTVHQRARTSYNRVYSCDDLESARMSVNGCLWEAHLLQRHATRCRHLQRHAPRRLAHTVHRRRKRRHVILPSHVCQPCPVLNRFRCCLCTASTAITPRLHHHATAAPPLPSKHWV